MTPASTAETASESQVKAAILFNLARFSEWSDDIHAIPDGEFRICTRTTAIMQKALSNLSGKTIHDRKLIITHSARTEQTFKDCEVLFISKDQIPTSIDFQSIHDNGVLTVGDFKQFLSLGGAMSIQRQAKKLKFSINSQAMKAANIKPSSKILALAVEPEI